MLVDKIKINLPNNKTISIRKLWDESKKEDETMYQIIEAISPVIEKRVGAVGTITVHRDMLEDDRNNSLLQNMVRSFSGKCAPAFIRIITTANNSTNFGIIYWIQEQAMPKPTNKNVFWNRILNFFK